MTALPLLLAASLLTQATPPRAGIDDFRSFATIATPDSASTPVRLHLTAGLLRAMALDQADLRVFDGRGQEAPYAILRETYPEREPASFAFTILSYTPTQGHEVLVVKRGSGEAPYDHLSFDIQQRDFKKNLTLEYSFDGQAWQPLASDTIFDFTSRVDLRKTAIQFPALNAPYLRLTIASGDYPEQGSHLTLAIGSAGLSLSSMSSASIRIDTIRGYEAESNLPRAVYDSLSLSPLSERRDPAGDSIIELGAVNLPLAELRLDLSNPYFYRQVELLAGDSESDNSFAPIAHALIYKIPGMRAPQDTLLIEGPLKPYLRLRVHNGDNPLLRITAVQARWVRQHLFFIPEKGQRYALYWGGGQVRKPEHELADLLAMTDQKPWSYPAAALGNPEANPHYRVRTAAVAPHTWFDQHGHTLLMVLVAFIAILMSYWIYRVLRSLPRPS